MQLSISLQSNQHLAKNIKGNQPQSKLKKKIYLVLFSETDHEVTWYLGRQ